MLRPHTVYGMSIPPPIATTHSPRVTMNRAAEVKQVKEGLKCMKLPDN